VVWTIENGKLANQIARLAAIVVKNNLSTKMLTGEQILQTKAAKIKHVVKLQFIRITTTLIYDLG